jgi:hypothetical protein
MNDLLTADFSRLTLMVRHGRDANFWQQYRLNGNRGQLATNRWRVAAEIHTAQGN